MVYPVDGQVQLAVLLHDLLLTIGIRHIHRAVRLEVVITGCNAIGIAAGYPQGCILKQRTVASVEEIILFTDLREALCADIVAEIIGFTADGGKAILQNVSVSAHPIMSCLQTCGIIQTGGNIATSVYRHLTVGTAENNTVFSFYSAVEYRAVFAVVCRTFSLDEPIADPGTNAGLLIEVPPGTSFTTCFNNREITIGNVSVLVSTVDALFQLNPSGHQIPACPVISCAAGSLHKCAANQNALIVEGVLHAADGADAGMHHIGCRIKVIIIFTDRLPAGFQSTDRCIVALSIDLQHTGILSLANIDSVFAKIIVETVCLLNAGQLFTVYIIGKTAILIQPAIFHSIDQGVAVVKFLIGILEIATFIIGVIGIYISIQAKGRLILGLLREGVQRTGAHIDLIADSAGVDRLKLILAVPLGILLGCQLQAVDNAHRIGGLRRNCLCLLIPVQGQCKGAVFLIQLNIGQGEILIDQGQLANIQGEIGIVVDHSLDFRKYADTLCKLTQECPGIGALHIRAGQHIGQLLKLCGDGNLGHIDCQNIGSDHILPRLNHSIDRVVVRSGVGNIPVPGKLTVTAGRLFKVESQLTLLIQRYLDTVRCAAFQRSCNRYIGQADRSITVCGKADAAHGAGLLIAQCKIDVRGYVRDLLALIVDLNGQFDGSTVYGIHIILGKADIVGLNNIHRLAADDFLAQHQINIHSAVTQTGKQALFCDCAPSFIGNGPESALRKLHSISCGADTNSR